MKRFLLCLILIQCIMLSPLGAIASKSKPNMVYDFEGQASEGITVAGKETQRFKSTFETGIGGREDNGYSYKAFAGEHTGTSGNSIYTVTIPIGTSESSVVTTEFDLYCNISANPTAKEKVVPALLIYVSNVNILWLTTQNMNSPQEGWKKLMMSEAYNNSWNRFAVKTDKAQRTCSAYFNGEQIVSNIPLPDTYTDSSCIKLEWSYWYNAPGPDCFFAFDNIISYDGILTPDDTITWKTQNGEIKSLSEIAPGDMLSVSYEKYNYSDEDTELTAILLVRNGSKLISARSQRVNVPSLVEPTVIESTPVEITDTSGLEVKLIFLNSWEERIPLCEAYALN